MNKGDNISSHLKNSHVLTLNEARAMGVNPMQITRAIKAGKLHRLCEAVYTDDLDLPFDPIKKYLSVTAKYPYAVIASISALRFHNLTDEEERDIWIALPHSKKIQGNSGVKVLRLSGRAYSMGIEIQKVGKREIKFYDREKSVVDAFKYLTEEIAIKALKAYLKQPSVDIPKLLDYSKKLGKPLQNEVKTIMTV